MLPGNYPKAWFCTNDIIHLLQHSILRIFILLVLLIYQLGSGPTQHVKDAKKVGVVPLFSPRYNLHWIINQISPQPLDMNMSIGGVGGGVSWFLILPLRCLYNRRNAHLSSSWPMHTCHHRPLIQDIDMPLSAIIQRNLQIYMHILLSAWYLFTVTLD